MIITLDHNTPPHLPRKVSAQTGKPLEPAQCRASKIGEIAQNNRHNRHNWPILRHLWMGGGCLSDKQTEKRKNSGCGRVRTTSNAEDQYLSILTLKSIHKIVLFTIHEHFVLYICAATIDLDATVMARWEH